MSTNNTYTTKQSNAFSEEFELGPWANGPLSGLTFAVSDFIDIEERTTGCGNPFFLSGRAPAACNAVSVDILLSSGAQCVGKTHVDEFGISLLGENSFYGTPLNPLAPDRVPGGSAGGAASAVACKHVDFAVALDSGSSIQVSASNCALYGFRPNHGDVSMAGVLPVAPSFDTVGALARDAATMKLLAKRLTADKFSDSVNGADASRTILFLEDAFSLIDEKDSAKALHELGKIGDARKIDVKNCQLRELEKYSSPAADMRNWYNIYIQILSMELWSSFGTWVEDRKPELGSEAKANMYRARMTDRSESAKAYLLREELSAALASYLGSGNILCIPATAEPAPKIGFIASAEDPGDYYPTTLSLCSIAPIARLAALTIPFGSGPALTFLSSGLGALSLL